MCFLKRGESSKAFYVRISSVFFEEGGNHRKLFMCFKAHITVGCFIRLIMCLPSIEVNWIWLISERSYEYEHSSARSENKIRQFCRSAT